MGLGLPNPGFSQISAANELCEPCLLLQCCDPDAFLFFGGHLQHSSLDYHLRDPKLSENDPHLVEIGPLFDLTWSDPDALTASPRSSSSVASASRYL